MGDCKEVELMDMSDTPWCWYYLADCGRWHKFEDDPHNPLMSENIERYYKTNPTSVLTINSVMMDFSVMLQTYTITGRKRRIKRSHNIIERSCPCFTAYPVFWERVEPTSPYQLIPLSELTPEYQTVADYVKKDGLLNRSIVSISRIQNVDLWDFFCLKKKQLIRIQGVRDIQERRLFHGTSVSNVDSICKNNFDLRLARQGVYGRGIYFAKHAAYADQYSTSSSDPSGKCTKIIFLARVIIGKSTFGQKHFKKPDHGSSENCHHSCVDDVTKPKIFVIFDPNQIYPEYLIEYKSAVI